MSQQQHPQVIYQTALSGLEADTMASISKRLSGSWVSGDYGIMKTATDTLSLPVTIYADGTAATLAMKGNTVQSGTPTPDSPIMPQVCGELETSGEDSDQYKIPVLSASTTTPAYLGEVETTRQIQKLVLTGNEGFARASGGYYLGTIVPDYARAQGENLALCSHYPTSGQTGSIANVPEKHISFSSGVAQRLYLKDSDFADATELNTYLQQQYANGTPVTVWYVLATEETAVVNEPLMRIGNYADEVSNVSIPVTAGGDTISVGTTVQPSEVTAAYHGWHNGAVKGYENGDWQPQVQALSLSNAPMLSNSLMAFPDMSEPEIEPETTE